MNVIMAMNIGKPNSLLVTIVSMMCVELAVGFSSFTIVSASAPAMNPYFSSAMAAVMSIPGLESSYSATLLSRSFIRWSASGRLST